MVLEVHVHPLAARLASFLHRDLDEAPADALVAATNGDHRVLYPGVDETVPRDVDEADERALRLPLARTHPRLCTCTCSRQSHSDSSYTRVSNASACSSLTSLLLNSPRHSYAMCISINARCCVEAEARGWPRAKDPLRNDHRIP